LIEAVLEFIWTEEGDATKNVRIADIKAEIRIGTSQIGAGIA
jgi:hypothetical protein